MYTLTAIILIVLSLMSIILIPFGLPGSFIIVGLSALFQILFPAQAFGWGVVFFLLAIAILLEIVEYLISILVTRRYGSSNEGLFGSVVGSIIGAFLGAGVIPLIGALLGAFLGALGGAALLEYLRNPDPRRALNIGFAAMIGTAGGKITKIIGALAMIIIMIVNL